MKIALQQMNSQLNNVATNFKKIDEAAKVAAENHAKLIVYPELCTTGYGAGDALISDAVTADENGLSALCKISKAHDIAIIAGYCEKANNGYYNSAAFIANGEVLTNYRKCQLWDQYEKDYFKAGAPSDQIIEFNGLRIGILICYDVEFPERVRALGKAGVDLIAVPTATPVGEASKFIATKMVPVRAFENQAFIAYSNHHGSDGKFNYAGRSCITAPDGNFLAQAASDGDALLFADIAPEAYAEFKKDTPYFRDLVEI